MIIFVFGLLLLYFYRSSCRGRHYIKSLYALTILVLNLTWFMNGGTLGSISYYFLAALLYPLTFFRGPGRWTMFLLLVVNTSALPIVEYYFPSLIIPFKTPQDRLIDLTTGVPFSCAACALLFWVVITNYDKESAKAANEIAERKRSEAELLGARKAADCASRAKSQFLANMSHEIRTPMNGIIGGAQLLGMTELCPEQKECLDYIRSSSESLLAIINDVLDLSKIEAGKIELECAPFCLRECLDQVVAPQFTLSAAKGLVLKTDIPDHVPDGLTGDQLRLKQIIANLVGNAVKFTHQGGITVSVALLESSDDAVLLQFSVSDTGIGINPLDMDKIFTPFTQADSSTSRKYGGTGLGLSISRELVDLMGGKIWVQSVEGRGSTFHIEVPFSTTNGRGGAAAEAGGGI
ncbi:hypothetical protein ET418_16230 [Oryzomonas rubra]|uniref:Sensory/regulatory protein RpfC n=2 Tax=Oryzomonas rubra TaxID=2509454 RepID=A0A5A9X9Q5_9BACT|nr:hypothetical protein ET418_16230 [Oryzomonas rubra]